MGGVEGGVLAVDLHLEDAVCLIEGAGVGLSEQGDQAALEGAEAALDLALGLGRRSHEMCDTQGAERPLELATRIAAVARGTRAEEAQGVGIDGLGEPDVLKSFPEVGEVGPGGVSGHEAPGDVEAGMVIDGEQEGLLARSGPPLVDRAVVLPEFAEAGPAKAAVGAGLLLRLGDQLGKMFFDVGLDAGTCPPQPVKAEEFVGNELVVGRGLKRHKLSEENGSALRPAATLVAVTGVEVKALADFEPEGAKLVEPGFSDIEKPASLGSVDGASIKIGDGFGNELEWQAVNNLALFISRC